jgi:3-polyprenyl-4-hydroxybenzoate decarboxylase
VLREIGQRFDPENHMWLLPFAPLDTLDFTSFTMHVGSKLVIDACGPVLRKDLEPAAHGLHTPRPAHREMEAA